MSDTSPINSAARFYANSESQRPASAHAFPVSNFDVHLDRPPGSVPVFRPISSTTPRVVYVNNLPRPRLVRQNSQNVRQPAAPARYAIISGSQRSREAAPYFRVQRPSGPRPQFRIQSTHPQVVRSNPPAVHHAPVYITSSQPIQPSTSPETPNEEEVQKCIRFFRTLTNLTNKDKKYPVGTTEQVKNLVKDVINGDLQPPDFTRELQELLGSKAQPQLLPFLRKNLPSLREGLRTGRYTIDLDDQPPADPSTLSGYQSTQPMPQVVYTTIPQQIVQAESQSMTSTQEVMVGASTGAPTMGNLTQPQVYVFPSSGITAPNTVYVDMSNSTTQESPAVPVMPDQLPYSLLSPQALWTRLAAEVPGCEGIESKVISRISEAIEFKLRNLVDELADVATHRLEPMRVNPFYRSLNDPRRQLRFVEDLEKQEYERRAELEKEALLKFSKTKSKDKDSQDRAKEIKRANQEESMNREANEAAIAALGGSRGSKRPWNTYNPMKNAATSGLSLQTHRPRVVRVNLRDLQCVLNCHEMPDSSDLKFQLAHGLIQVPGPKANLGGDF